jgi:glutamate-1-semialdehyde aminotransferase
MLRLLLFFAGLTGAIIAMAANSKSNAKKDARALYDRINENRSEWDTFIDGLSTDLNLPGSCTLFAENTELYMVKKERANISSSSLNNKMPRNLSEPKFRKLMHELDNGKIAYTYSLQSHSVYYKISDNEMLWVYYP